MLKDKKLIEILEFPLFLSISPFTLLVSLFQENDLYNNEIIDQQPSSPQFY